jgi:hypothetical protein
MLLWLAAFLPLGGFASKRSPAPRVAPAPAMRIPLEPLGLLGTPTRGLLRSRAAIATLDFLDDNHVLLTFAERPLMRREDAPGEAGNVPVSPDHPRDDRMVCAEVVELPSGKVVRRQDWRVYDRDPYLLALGGGKFLLREGGRISLLDSGLHATTLAESKVPIVYAQADPSSDLLLVETEHTIHTPEQRAKMEHDALLFNAPRPVEQADVFGWRLPVSTPPSAAIFHARLPEAGPLTGNADGLLEFSSGSGDRFELFFVPFGSNGTKRILGRFKSDCRPSTRSLRRDVMLVTGCRNGSVEEYAISTTGELLWKQKAEGGALPDFAFSADGKRFAQQTVGGKAVGTSAVVASEGLTEDDFASGLVQVFDVDTGARVFATALEPLYAAYRTVALSPDGLRLAVLRKGALEVYALPPLQESTLPSEATPRAAAAKK